MNIIPISQKSAKIAIFSCQKSRVPNEIETWINQNSVVTGIWTDPEKDKSLAVLFSEQSLVEKRYFSKIAVLYQCAGKRTFATPKPNPNPPKPSFFKKKLVRKSQKLKKQGVLTVNIIPISQKSAKIAIFSCQKSRVPNEIETWINQNSVVTGIWTDPEKDKSLAVLFSEQSLVEKRYFSKIAVLYIYIYIFGCWQAPEPSWHIRILFSWSLSKSRFLPHQKILFLSKVIAV